MSRRSNVWIQGSIVLIWSLWFGGIIALFVFVQTLFTAVPRDTFIQTAPHLFFAFERYQLILAAIALSLTVLWRVTGGVRANAVFVSLAIATLLAVLSTAVITPRIEQLRVSGQTQSDQFKKMHGLSMCVYLAESIAVLVAGIILLWPRERETAETFAAASPFPVAAGRPESARSTSTVPA